jgi:ribulose-5-phosphate 4-epimerase/fuculose-1-phosphate aldolase
MVPALTPYVVMRVGRVARVPYSRPGDGRLKATVSQAATAHRALLLANHGPVVSAADLSGAVAAAEELEETARLFFLLEGRPHRELGPEEIGELERVFGR